MANICFFIKYAILCIYCHWAGMKKSLDNRAVSQYKDRFPRYGDSHAKYKTVARPSCPYYGIPILVMPQSHPTTDPERFLAPARFLTCNAEWCSRKYFTPVLLSWSHRATGPVRFDTTPYGNSQCFSYLTVPAWAPCGTCKSREGIDTTRICKIPARPSYVAVRGPTVPLSATARAVRGLFTISKPVRARKLTMHASKLYGSRTGTQNSYGAARSPWVDVRFLFKTAREQPGIE